MSNRSSSNDDSADKLDGVDETQQFFASEGKSESRSPGEPTVAPYDDPTIQLTNAGVTSPSARSTIGDFGEYHLQREIARGGMGVVYQATQRGLNRKVALKMILAGQLASKDDVRRFYTEAEAAAKLDHPNIVPIYEVGQCDDTHFFSMKLIEGSDVGREMRKLRSDLPSAIKLLSKVCRAVDHAHQRGILHRDLKPANILIDHNLEPFVTDLGLARSLGTESDITRTGAIVGTPSYMSPEQAAGNSDLTTATDVYSLGVILYEMLTGHPPFKAASPMETLMQVINDEPIRPMVSGATDRSLEMIALKCLSKTPSDRYRSAAELAEDLDRWLNGEPISIRAPSLAALTRSWLRQNFGRAGWIIVIGLISGLVAGFAVWNATIQREIAGSLSNVYSELVSQEPPSVWMQWITPSWLTVPCMLLFTGSLSMLGYFTALLVRTKNPSADIAAGLAVGVIAGASAFYFALSTMSISATIDDTDLRMLGLLANAPLGETPQLVLDRFPEFAEVDRMEQVQLLKQKIYVDRTYAIPRGIKFASIACLLLFVVAGVAETLIAGKAVRRGQSWWQSLGEYLFSSFPYVVATTYGGLHAGIFLIMRSTGLIVDGLSATIICLLALAVAAEFFKWRLWIRAITVILVFPTLMLFLRYDFPILMEVARNRTSLTQAVKKADRYPQNAGAILDAASSFQLSGISLYEAGRYTAAQDFFADGVRFIENIPAPSRTYALDGVLGSAFGNSAHTLWQLGRQDEAQELILQAVADHPENAQLHVSAVEFLLARKLPRVADRIIANHEVSSPATWRTHKQMVFAKSTFKLQYRSAEYMEASEAARQILADKLGTADASFSAANSSRLAAAPLFQNWLLVSPPTGDELPELERLMFQRQTTQGFSLDGEYWTGQGFQVAKSEPFEPNQVTLSLEFPDAGEHTATFAIAKVNSGQAQTCTFALGSDDGVSMWLNGELLLANSGSRSYADRDDLVSGDLNAGENTILIQIFQNQGPWSFGLQIDAADGWPAQIEWQPVE